MLETCDTGKLGEEVVGRLGGDQSRLSKEITGLGVLEFLLSWAVENTDRLGRAR